MAIAAAAVDALVKEYLIFRGFTTSLKSFENDIKIDRNKSFKVECIVDQFSSFVQTYDIIGLKHYWKYFDKYYFCHLGPDTYKLIKRLETCVLRLYVVHALQTNKIEKVSEFFEKYIVELQHEESWKDWFVLPYIRNPEQNKSFTIYFTKIWQESVMLSLANCLNTIFTHMSLPALLNFEKERANLTYLNEERIKLKEQIDALQKEIAYFRKESQLAKVSCASQTNDNNMDVQDNSKGRRKSPLARPRFGWKLLGSKDKDNKTSQKDNDLCDKAVETNLHKSLDETALRKQKGLLTGSAMTTTDNSLPSSDKEKDTSSNSSTCSAQDEEVNLGSTFYAALEDKSIQKPGEPLQKSISYSEGNSKKPFSSSTSSYYAENITETPFIILSQDEFKEHTSAIVSCKFSENNNLVSSLDLDGILKIWQCYPTVAHSSSISLKADILSFDWLPKAESRLMLGKASGQLSIYDINLRKTMWESSVNQRYKRIVSVACNPVAASGVCSAASPVVENKRNSSHGSKNSSQKMIRMWEYTSFNSSNASRPGYLSVWDLQTGQHKNELCLDPFPVCIHSLSYNHNGTLLVTGGADGMVRLYDVRNCDCLIGWHAHSTNVLDVMFDPDETSIYSIGADGKVCVWDINKVSSKIAEFPLHLGSTGIKHYCKSGELHVHNMEDVPCGKLLDCDSEGQHMMACGPSGLMIYKVKPKTEMEEVMHILSPSSEAVTLDWTSSPNCSTAMCGTIKGNIHVSTLLRK